MKIYGELDLLDEKVAYHLVSNTDLLNKYLKDCEGKFSFDYFADFACDEISNEAEVIESVDAVGAYEDEFSVNVMEYQGIFFVQANEFDDIRYFLKKESAEAAAFGLASDYQ